MKIVIISHVFTDKKYTKRWEKLAEAHKELDITLLSPRLFVYGKNKALSFGKIEKRIGYEKEKENFHIKLFKMKNHKYFEWTSKEMMQHIKSIKPDIIYHIGFHRQESLMQVLNYKKINKKVKIYVFSMRGPHHNIDKFKNKIFQNVGIYKLIYRIQYLYENYKLKKFNKFCDAVFCHYPEALCNFKNEGFEKPIFIQTQVGVDTDIFYKDLSKRDKIRKEYNIGNSFLFASAIRFTEGKGALQILEALPINGDWKYILMGSGTKEEITIIKEKIKERKIEDKVILPGFIERNEMASYWNAADCAIHFPQTTDKWIETFSLSLVQAMATHLPVIGSNSGSVPYQIGPAGIVIEESNISLLHEKLQWIINNQEEGKKIGEKLYNRAIDCFSINHLNKLFYETIIDLNNNKI